MKIAGVVDAQDILVWDEYHAEFPGGQKATWWGWLLVVAALVAAVFLARDPEGGFDWKKLLILLVSMVILYAGWRAVRLLSVRAAARDEQQTFPFEIERTGATIRLHAGEEWITTPAHRVGATAYKDHLIITVDDLPVCIVPRDENLEHGQTNADIADLIGEAEGG